MATTNRARVKSVEESIRDTEEPDHQLRKNLSALDLTVFGVGVIIGLVYKPAKGIKGDIAFSLYEGDNYNIYKLPANPPSLNVATTNTAPSSARAGQLPPLRGTGSTITAYLQKPEEGLLPAGTTFTQASYRPSLHIAYKNFDLKQ